MDIREKVARAIAERRGINPDSEVAINPYHLVMADSALLACGYEKMREALAGAEYVHSVLSECESAIIQLRDERNRMREALADAQFLLDRLADVGDDGFTDDGARDWYGHTSPAISRAAKSVAAARAALGEDKP